VVEQVRRRLVSVAGLAGRPVRLADGREAGRIEDVVVRWGADTYPAVTGLVVRIGRRRAFVPADAVADLDHDGAELGSAVVDLRDFVARHGEVALGRDVLDHQLVDVDGIQVIRANDLYLARLVDGVRLVGVEVGARSLLRRLGPARRRRVPVPERVVDWSAIRAFGPEGGAGAVQLDRSRAELRRLRPADLAHLLEDLDRPRRQELLAALDAGTAADALEEMDEDERDQLLRETRRDRAAAIVAEMEPDEAAEALRDLPGDDRDELLAHLPAGVRTHVGDLLARDRDAAGGMMTTTVVRVPASRRVGDVARDLAAVADHRGDVDAVLVVDHDGVLIDDVSLFELLTAPADVPVGSLVAEPWPVTVAVDTPADEVVDAVLANRSASVVVVDAAGRPVGRILADDVLDHLVADRRPRRARRAS
jgi:CBS domain-containing protein